MKTEASRPARFRRALLGLVAGLVTLVVLAILVATGDIVAGMHAAARVSGIISGVGVRAPVEIVRDGRDIPHIRAANLHDLFFAQGYAEGSDRLFQIDLTRHFVYGTLTELLGAGALRADEVSRQIDNRTIIAKQWKQLSKQDRSVLSAFSAGVNASETREPLPVEYRILFAKPQPWTPQDSLAVGFATILGQTESWNDVANRNLVYRTYGPKLFASIVPLTDPKYDAPTTDGKPATLPALAALTRPSRQAGLPPDRPEIVRAGSNEWAAGGALTATGRALLANDPHLKLGIPGIWYLVDLQAPGYHVAGVSLAGTPGVILGHNDRVAWGITNGNTAAFGMYSRAAHSTLLPRRELFNIRFGKSVEKTYFGTADGGFEVFDVHGNPYIVKWQSAVQPRSPVGAFFALDRAQSIPEALRAVASYRGPSFNFVLADTSGAVAYHLGGTIPRDPAWAQYAHNHLTTYPMLPFDALPKIAPSRSTLAFTSNNRMYGARYHYRLSATFAPPYRAARVQMLLRGHSRYTVARFARMQMDTYSIPEAELAHDVIVAATRRPKLVNATLRPLIYELQHWDGRYQDGKRGATIAWNLRRTALDDLYGADFEHDIVTPSSVVLLRALRERPHGWVTNDDYDAWLLAELQRTITKAGGVEKLDLPWSAAGAITVRHPLDALGIHFLDGTRLPGAGDAFTVHVQSPGFGQSFRAVWDVGSWDAGGITLPQGESGEPGSRHYSDLAADWTSGKLVALPYSRAAVEANARARLVLMP